ncbi:Uncharacterised protein [Citrobacter koseri]|uniref:Uncharacterized protein n=1 Tax=Citrobacter koseri TaxID=545 RepID=A0A3S4KN83_CITKO|nr:Uncharacterised protein [Citrobacter koseri]
MVFRRLITALIQGDNLHILQYLTKHISGKVNVFILIRPTTMVKVIFIIMITWAMISGLKIFQNGY